MPRTAGKGGESLVLGHESNHQNDPNVERRKKAETYALEMTIQVTVFLMSIEITQINV
jgi:hypothetical protein